MFLERVERLVLVVDKRFQTILALQYHWAFGSLNCQGCVQVIVRDQITSEDVVALLTINLIKKILN